jgi:hypothetical protein
MRSQNPSTLELSCCVALLVATARRYTARRHLMVAALPRSKVNYALEDQLQLDYGKRSRRAQGTSASPS